MVENNSINQLNITWSDECCLCEAVLPYFKGVELLSKAVNLSSLFKENVKTAEQKQPKLCGRIITRIFVFFAGAGMLIPIINIPVYMITRSLLELKQDNSKKGSTDDVKELDSGIEQEETEIAQKLAETSAVEDSANGNLNPILQKQVEELAQKEAEELKLKEVEELECKKATELAKEVELKRAEELERKKAKELSEELKLKEAEELAKMKADAEKKAKEVVKKEEPKKNEVENQVRFVDYFVDDIIQPSVKKEQGYPSEPNEIMIDELAFEELYNGDDLPGSSIDY